MHRAWSVCDSFWDSAEGRVIPHRDRPPHPRSDSLVTRYVLGAPRFDQPDQEITYEFVLDRLCIYGTVNKVVDQLLALREQVGDFGELVYAGMDWVDPKLEKRSMQLMAEQVMPRVNAAIGKSAAA